MKRELFQTGDGSWTFHLPEWNEQYHSKHGAVQEALHVFIEAGLHYFVNSRKQRTVSILEMGFGTGLNALLTFQAASQHSYMVEYHGVEAYPISLADAHTLNYSDLVSNAELIFPQLHSLSWETLHELSKDFQLKKYQRLFSEVNFNALFDIIYYDAFGARVQPELWTESIFESMYKALKKGGVLVTYSAKGSVRRALQTVGFEVSRLPGPPGKREMLRAEKLA